MAGIVFLPTRNQKEVVEFYRTQLEMTLWLTQPDITILRHENLLVGFQSKPELDDSPHALITFFYASRNEVDAIYSRLEDRAYSPPKENPRYQIYNFYAVDPENRTFECQCFLHELPAWS